jgi:hypothetical protein
MTAITPRSSEDPGLVIRAFIALAIATLAFFVAGGIVLPVASLYAKGPLGTDLVSAIIAAGGSLLLVVKRDSARVGRTTADDAAAV